MSQPNNDHPYEIAHLVARLAGEEGPDHSRQEAVRWLEASGYGAEVGRFNQAYHARMRGHNTSGTATFGAFVDTFGLAEARHVYLSYVASKYSAAAPTS